MLQRANDEIRVVGIQVIENVNPGRKRNGNPPESQAAETWSRQPVSSTTIHDLITHNALHVVRING